MKSPILFLIFNRPKTTQRVFDQIRFYKPEKLFIAADGPRSSKQGEAELCRQTREIVNQIDWPCQVKTLFRDQNLGCKIAVSSAITWFFEHVESGIILEDDCLPNPSFFDYCNDLLNKYKDNSKIMLISGDNFQDGIKRGTGDYYFSKYPHIWGWATWKRAWSKYDVSISQWPTIKKNDKLFSNIFEKNYWSQIFDMVFKNQINTWDYQWLFTIWVNNGLSICPNVNLVSNIGFGADSTHTSIKNSMADIPTFSLNFPLKHPSTIKPDKPADQYTSKHIFKINPSHIILKFIYDTYKFRLPSWIKK